MVLQKSSGSLGDNNSPSMWSRGEAPVRHIGDQVFQKLKKNVQLLYKFQR